MKYYYDPAVYDSSKGQSSLATSTTGGIEIPTNVKPSRQRGDPRDARHPRAPQQSTFHQIEPGVQTNPVVENELFQKLFVKNYYRNPFFNTPKREKRQVLMDNPDFRPDHQHVYSYEWHRSGHHGDLVGPNGHPIHAVQVYNEWDPSNSLEQFRLLRPIVSLATLREIRSAVIREETKHMYRYNRLGGPPTAGYAAMPGHHARVGASPMPKQQPKNNQGGVTGGVIPSKYQDSIMRQIAGFDAPVATAGGPGKGGTGT